MILDMISVLLIKKFTEVWFVTQDVVYPGECFLCTCKEIVFFCLDEMFWIYQWYFWANVPFEAFVSLLKLCFDDQFTGVSRMLRSYTINVLLPVSPFILASIFLCIEVLLCWVHRCLGALCYVFLLDWSLDHYVVSSIISCNILYFKVILSDMRINNPAFFWFPFA